MPEIKPRYDLTTPISTYEYERLPLGSRIVRKNGEQKALFAAVHDGKVYRTAWNQTWEQTQQSCGIRFLEGMYNDTPDWYLNSEEDAKTVGREPLPLTKEEKYDEIVKLIKHSGSFVSPALTLTDINKIIND